VQVLVGRDQGGRDLAAAQELAVIGGDEIGADAAGDVGAAVGVPLRDADPFDRWMARRNLAAEQPDPPRSHDGEPDALGFSSHCETPVRLRSKRP